MFNGSDNATVAIRILIGRSNAPAGTGMRIAPDIDRSSVHIAISPGPQPGDAVYDAGDNTHLFIAQGAGELLEGKTIDTREDEAGQPQFLLDSPQ